MSNYPDDIRQHDDNPNSPFYDDSREVWLESRTEQIKYELLSDEGYTAGRSKHGVGDIISEIIYQDEEKAENFEAALMDIITDKPDAVNYFRMEMDEFALQLAKQLAADELAAKENDCEQVYARPLGRLW